ncbi:MAG: DVUA0089 family protein [Bryobacteraceae bacterium]
MAKHKLSLSLLTLLFSVAAAQQLKAVTVTNVNLGTLSGSSTRAGTLSNQGEVLEATFSITSVSNLTIYTNSYGGGTNANGTTATAGGFMPSLVLYNSAGNFVAGETFPSPIGRTDPATGLNGDAYLSRTNLSVGTYILTLSDFLVQQPATATNLSDGFINFGSGTTFSDVQGNSRTGNYSLNLSTTSTTPSVPEPATFGLMIPALVGVAALVRKRKAAL